MYDNEFQSYRDITLLNQDGMNKLLTITNQLIYEKWIKLTDMCRTQVNGRHFSFMWIDNFEICYSVILSK